MKMSVPKRKDSTLASYGRSLFLRWNQLQLNAMEELRLKDVPSLHKSPKITSQSRLVVGAKSRIADAENSFRMENDQEGAGTAEELVGMSKVKENDGKEVGNLGKVIPTVKQ